jgi:hypothetical protein
VVTVGADHRRCHTRETLPAPKAAVHPVLDAALCTFT